MRTLGIDYGDRRIGLAISDPSGTLARPWRTLAPGGTVAVRAGAVAAVVRAAAAEPDGLAAIVVGLPRRLDGGAHPLAVRVRAFADALGAATRLPVALLDERLTSVAAEERLAVGERDWRTRKARLDAAAAAVILQEHLDRRRPARDDAARDAPAPAPGAAADDGRADDGGAA